MCQGTLWLSNTLQEGLIFAYIMSLYGSVFGPSLWDPTLSCYFCGPPMQHMERGEAGLSTQWFLKPVLGNKLHVTSTHISLIWLSLEWEVSSF